MTHLDDNALTMLAAGETGALAAWRQRRHLKTCPPCRAQWAETERLWMLAQTLRDDAVPASLKHSTLSALHKEKIPMQTTFKTSFRPRRGMATLAALAACLAAVSGALLWPGSPVRPLPAFAQVEQAMSKIDSVTFMRRLEIQDANGNLFRTETRHWLRRNPPVVVTHQQLNLPFMGPEWKLQDGQQRRVYKERTGTWIVTPLRYDVGGEVAQDIQELTHPASEDRFGNVRHWQSRQAMLNGARALQFVSIEPENAPDAFAATRIVWADAKTKRVLKSEFTETRHGKIVARQTDYDVQYGIPSPAGIFERKPPPGARVVSADELRRIQEQYERQGRKRGRAAQK